jgi:hypothetical protein
VISPSPIHETTRTGPRRPLRPRFFLRDILWLTLLVALAAAWWRDHCAGALREERHIDRFHLIIGTLNFAESWIDDNENFDRERVNAWLHEERAKREEQEKRWAESGKLLKANGFSTWWARGNSTCANQ